MAAPKHEVVDDVASRVATLVSQLANDAISKRGSFSIAIAGGSLVKMLGSMKAMPGVEWNKWVVAWVDERCVPHSDPESNYGGAWNAWLSMVPIPPDQIYSIDEQAVLESPDAAARNYEARLRELPISALPRENDLPRFDLLLLGFGPDGNSRRHGGR
mmetsp:Transcript_20846/g.34387  ORF Transcript_20846/g.34387 Transcript_20846/m.34387 type:complete len:158 (-) Transcript_20846:399-872(-)